MALGLLSAEFSREKAGAGISIQYISSSPLRRKAASRSDRIDGMRHPEDFFSIVAVFTEGEKRSHASLVNVYHANTDCVNARAVDNTVSSVC